MPSPNHGGRRVGARSPHAPPVVMAPIVHRLVREHCAPWLGGWPLPTAGGRRRARLLPMRAPPDHALPSAVASEDEEERTLLSESALLRLREEGRPGVLRHPWAACTSSFVI